MKKLKFKALVCLMVAILMMIGYPLASIAESQASPITNEQQLHAAIEAIPQGESGEITIENRNFSLNNGMIIEDKDVVLNLINTQIFTNDQPVLMAANSNVTINADEQSLFQVNKMTDDSYSVDTIYTVNYSDFVGGSFTESFTFTINGGKYFAREGGVAISVSSGYSCEISNACFYGPVEAVAAAGVEAGKITVINGIYANDISSFVAPNKYCQNYFDYWYVRDTEYTDDFNKLFPDKKITFNCARPNEDAVWVVIEDFVAKNPDITIQSFNEDMSKCDVAIHINTLKEEYHTVDVEWVYDEEVAASVEELIKNFPTDRDWFEITDLEFINYLVNSNIDPDLESDTNTMVNYSSELKEALNHSNFILSIDWRGGGDEPFLTERIGVAKLLRGGVPYYIDDYLGARANHAIYVPSSTGNSQAELIAAALKRIEDYIGEGKVKLSNTDLTVEDYYENEIEYYDNEIANAELKMAAEEQKGDNRDWGLYFECEYILAEYPQYKQNFINSFKEGGDLEFLNDAAGGYIFDFEFGEEVFPFVIIKDDDKLIVPTVKSKDFNTNVEVSSSSSELPLDTSVEVERLTEGTEYDRIIKALDTEENEMFDIKLYSETLNKYITKLENGKFQVKLPIPEKLEGKNLTVYYVDANNNTTEHDVTVEGGFATFETDHFSIYTLTASKAAVPAPTPEIPTTGDNSNIAIWFIISAVSVIALLGSVAVKCREK